MDHVARCTGVLDHLRRLLSGKWRAGLHWGHYADRFWLRRQGLLENTITIEHYHDLGKWMFAVTVFWAYAAFAQYMLIWYANIPEETQYFFHRYQGSWYAVSLFQIFGHFLFPFCNPDGALDETQVYGAGNCLRLSAGDLLHRRVLDGAADAAYDTVSRSTGSTSRALRLWAVCSRLSSGIV